MGCLVPDLMCKKIVLFFQWLCVPWSLISGAAGHTQVRVAVTQRGPGFPQRDAESRAAKPLGRSSEVDILH